MPVHNALPFLDAAVESILRQSFRDFEFVVLDDGSTDGSGEALRRSAARDDRIRLFATETRQGAVGSSNQVVRASRAPLVARMDADDVAHPGRLAMQVALFDLHPEAVLAGGCFDVIDAGGRRLRPAEPARILRSSRFAPFAHPTVAFRRDAFDAVGGYRTEAERWEDVDLYLRMAAIGPVFVTSDTLISVRVTGTSTRDLAGRGAFETSMVDMYAAVERRAAGPKAVIAAAAPTMWAGRRPGALRRLARRRWRPDRAGLAALIWAAWADAHPPSLRAASRLAVRWRNARARVEPGRWYRWAPPA